MYKIRTQGFSLIEVLVAIAVIAGAALLVSQFVVSQSKGQIQVREKSSCEAALSGVIAKLKEKDNNANIADWLPKPTEVDPPANISARMSLPIVNGYKGSPLGRFEIASTNMGVSNSPPETTFARNFNNYQLIESTSSILVGLLRKDPSYATGKDARGDEGFLADTVDSIVDGSVSVQATITANGVNCNGLPINVSTVAGTSGACEYGISLTASYEDTAGATRSCTTQASFSPGSDLQAPTVAVSVSPVTTGLVSTGNILCGQGISRASFSVNIAQGLNAERGVQYACRLDYLAGLIPTTSPFPNRDQGTDWFLCSLPEASITNMLPGLSVGAVDASSNTSVNFTIENAIEGSYRLHVKAIDPARNESAVAVRDIILDLTRPTINMGTNSPNKLGLTSSNANLPSNYRFQCTNQAHNRWTVTLDEAITVSPRWDVHHYHTGINLANTVTCAATQAASIETPGVAYGTNWVDGPKTGEFAACDACISAFPAIAPHRESATWFIETTVADMPSAPISVSFNGSRFIYDADSNSQNPYTIDHTALQSAAIPISTVTMSPLSPYTRNVYDLTNRTANLSPVVFPDQASNAILACEVYGTYKFSVVDGCNRPASPSNIHRAAYSYTATGNKYTDAANATYGIPVNARYCPTFENIKVPTTPNNFNVNACPAPLQPCDTITTGGYSGNRGSGGAPSCTFYPNANRSCKYPTCARPGGGPPMEVGESISVYASSTAACGGCGSPQVRRCIWTGTNSVLTGSGSALSCTEAPCQSNCPGNKIGSNGNLGGVSFTSEAICEAHANTQPNTCVYVATAAGFCGDPVAAGCPTTQPQGPYATMSACTSAGNTNCSEVSTGVFCGEANCPASGEPYVYVWEGGEPTGANIYNLPNPGCPSGESAANTFSQVCKANGGTGGDSTCCTGSPAQKVACSSAPVNGACGIGNTSSGYRVTPPNHHLCATGGGTPTAVVDPGSSGGNWTWTCQGSVAGSTTDDQDCSAPKIIDGVCGTANGASFATAPTSDLCSNSSTTPSVTGSGPWTWTCSGVNGGNSPSCTAQMNATCAANKQEYVPQPYVQYIENSWDGDTETKCGSNLSGCLQCPYYSGCESVGGIVCAQPRTPFYGWAQYGTTPQTIASNDPCRAWTPGGWANSPINQIPCTLGIFLGIATCRSSSNDGYDYQCQAY